VALGKLAGMAAAIEGGLTALVAEMKVEFPGVDFTAMEQRMIAAIDDVHQIVAEHKSKIRNTDGA
jgi:hypothetical protein